MVKNSLKYESIPSLREFNAESIKLTDTDQHEPTMKMCEFWQGKDEPIAIKIMKERIDHTAIKADNLQNQG